MWLVWLVCGFIFGWAVTRFVFFMRCGYGTIRIDLRDPKKDRYRLDISNLEELSKRKRVILKVDNNADLSQK